MNPADIREQIRASRLAQGLPPTITDPSALARVAELVSLAGTGETPVKQPLTPSRETWRTQETGPGNALEEGKDARVSLAEARPPSLETCKTEASGDLSLYAAFPGGDDPDQLSQVSGSGLVGNG